MQAGGGAGGACWLWLEAACRARISRALRRACAGAGPRHDELNPRPSAPQLSPHDLRDLGGAGPSGSSAGSSGGGSAGSSRADLSLCVICMAQPRGTVLVPCGHRALCVGCSESPQRGRACPICRAPVLSVVRVFDA